MQGYRDHDRDHDRDQNLIAPPAIKLIAIKP
jgi:hypothetical protein